MGNVKVGSMVTAADKVRDHGKTVVFLMRREVTEVNSDIGQKAKAIALFDLGSQSSLMTKEVGRQNQKRWRNSRKIVDRKFRRWETCALQHRSDRSKNPIKSRWYQAVKIESNGSLIVATAVRGSNKRSLKYYYEETKGCRIFEKMGPA